MCEKFGDKIIPDLKKKWKAEVVLGYFSIWSLGIKSARSNLAWGHRTGKSGLEKNTYTHTHWRREGNKSN